MAIQNVFSGLTDLKTIDDFAAERLAREAQQEQILNSRKAREASDLSIADARAKQFRDEKLRQIALNSVITDEQGNKKFDTKAYTNEAYSIDPMGAVDLESKLATNAKTLAAAQKELLGIEANILKDKEDLIGKKLDNSKKLVDFSVGKLNTVSSIDDFNKAQQEAMQFADALGIKNHDIGSWKYQNLPNLLKQGLSSKEAIDYQLNQRKAELEQKKFNNEQLGVMTPETTQKTIRDIQSGIQAVKNASKIDDTIQGYEGVKSLFAKDTKGNVLYKGDSASNGLYDNQLIIAYNRAVNPGNQVTLEEGKVTGNTDGWDDRILGIARMVAQGKRLNKDQAITILKITSEVKDAKVMAVDRELQPFVEQANALNLPKDRIFSTDFLERLNAGKGNNKEAQGTRGNPLGGLPNFNQSNMPQSPFTLNGKAPPPYNGSLDNRLPAPSEEQKQAFATKNNIAPPLKFTAIPKDQRQAIAKIAIKQGTPPQEMYDAYLRSKGLK